MRELTGRIQEYYEMAREDGLENPLGRAVYAMNRMLNTHRHPAMETMRRCRPETAEKWRAHWERGGSVRVLSMTDAEYREHAFQKRLRLLPEGERLRRVIRRIRRKVARGEVEA